MFKKNREHEYDSYLYGLVLCKSTVLMNYISTHPMGEDFARNKIIKMKYDISKINPILHGLYKRCLDKPENVSLDWDNFYTLKEQLSRRFSISIKGDLFTHEIHTDEIKIERKYTLTEDEINAKIFLSIYKAIRIRQQQQTQFDFNLKSKNTIELYSSKYRGDYP